MASTAVPSMTVFGIKQPDNTYKQISEVEWHHSNDASVSKESDGSYTVRSTTNSFSLRSLLLSLGSPVVNIDLSYAKRSSSMTAEGKVTFDTLIEALNYLDDGTRIELTPTLLSSDVSAKQLMQRRLDELVRMLSAQSDIKFLVRAKHVIHQSSTVSGKLKSRRADAWRIRIKQKRTL